jgi:hypothetical protein
MDDRQWPSTRELIDFRASSSAKSTKFTSRLSTKSVDNYVDSARQGALSLRQERIFCPLRKKSTNIISFKNNGLICEPRNHQCFRAVSRSFGWRCGSYRIRTLTNTALSDLFRVVTDYLPSGPFRRFRY